MYNELANLCFNIKITFFKKKCSQQRCKTTGAKLKQAISNWGKWCDWKLEIVIHPIVELGIVHLRQMIRGGDHKERVSEHKTT